MASLHEDELRRDAEGRVIGANATVGWSDASSQNHFVRNLYNTRGGLVASEDAYAQGIYPPRRSSRSTRSAISCATSSTAPRRRGRSNPSVTDSSHE